MPDAEGSSLPGRGRACLPRCGGVGLPGRGWGSLSGPLPSRALGGWRGMGGLTGRGGAWPARTLAVAGLPICGAFRCAHVSPVGRSDEREGEAGLRCQGRSATLGLRHSRESVMRVCLTGGLACPASRAGAAVQPGAVLSLRVGLLHGCFPLFLKFAVFRRMTGCRVRWLGLAGGDCGL